jgi:hypothetical protein
MALALGAETELLTRLPPDYPAGPLAGLGLRPLPAQDVARYVNSYDGAGNRQQLLLHEGEPIPREAFAGVARPDILFLAPAFHELDGWPDVEAGVRAISLQGVLRARDGDTVVPAANAFEVCAPFAATGVLAFYSDEDTASPASLAEELAAMGVTVLLTHGQAGASLYRDERVFREDAFTAIAVDPTGAGDAFAMACTVRFAETGDMAAALSFGLMAGALAVEGAGLDAVPARAAIEARLAQVAA